jgi:hypothetical protein
MEFVKPKEETLLQINQILVNILELAVLFLAQQIKNAVMDYAFPMH